MKDHDRVVELAGGLELVDDAGNSLVEGCERADALGEEVLLLPARDGRDPTGDGLVRDVALVERRRVQGGQADILADVGMPGCGRRRTRAVPLAVAPTRPVGRDEGRPQEERPVGRAELADQLPRLLGDDVRVVVLVAELHQLTVGVLQEGVVVGQDADDRTPTVPPGLDAVVLVVAVHVLADEPGGVAGGLQPDRQRRGRVEALMTAPGRRVRADAVVVRVLASEDLRPRRATVRVGRDHVEEGDPGPAQQPPRRRQPAHLRPRLVIGRDQHDVGGIGCGRRGPRPARGRRRRVRARPARAEGRCDDQSRSENDGRESHPASMTGAARWPGRRDG